MRYEGDLTNQGGPVVDFAQSHPVYLLPGGTCPISVCWGDPAGFLKNLAYSQFIHLADQYIGLGASGRYTLGVSLKGSYTPPAVPLTDADVEAVVHAAVVATGLAGYGHIYHVFLQRTRDKMSVSIPPTRFAIRRTIRAHILFLCVPWQGRLYGCRTCALHRRALPECARLPGSSPGRPMGN